MTFDCDTVSYGLVASHVTDAETIEDALDKIRHPGVSVILDHDLSGYRQQTCTDGYTYRVWKP